MCIFTCSDNHIFAKIIQEMKKILLFIISVMFCIGGVDAAVRGENASVRGKTNTTNTGQKNNTRSLASRTANKTTVRTATPVTVLMSRSSSGRANNSSDKKVATRTATNARVATTPKAVTVRATTTNTSESSIETKTGAAYEQCKNAFFTCMDQFCELKNDSFRRCSCSDRVFDFQDIISSYQDVNERLTEFSEDLDVVGLSKEQVIAMKTASEGEDAMTEDKSASKLLLQAIMNSIKGEDSTVGGKYKDLNSIVISPDMSYAFGMEDSGQIIASYNGTTLYKAVYPKCRTAVQADCNNSSLQRAVNAYLMAVEQDCNTVESALVGQQKALKSATYEASALLDLARVENRKNRNSDDVATCLSNVEQAIQSEEVCGANYHKCLDNGQFIDVTTGAPLTGVTDFYKLGELLSFKTGKDVQNQNLSSIPNNRDFVQFFENKTKKFAQTSLDKCSENADYVWQQYLDRALVDIYYAQQSKVQSIKQSCIDLVAKCYDNQNVAIEKALSNLTGESVSALKPSIASLSAELCSDYIDSCNGMFATASGDIIKEYINNKTDTDVIAGCRDVAQQCFDKFGGTGYNNFYYPQSGLFETGKALDWFTLYDEKMNIVSPCAEQLKNTTKCDGVLEKVFGGFNVNKDTNVYSYQDVERQPRTTGVATEVYYKVLDNLRNQCESLSGGFVDYVNVIKYGYQKDNFCLADTEGNTSSAIFINKNLSNNMLSYWYHFYDEENMCPADYWTKVDTRSWGVCSCWENGGYRSKNGTIAICRPLIPSINGSDESGDPECTDNMLYKDYQESGNRTVEQWCLQNISSVYGQICPTKKLTTDTMECGKNTSNGVQLIQVVKEFVPHRK